MRVSCPIYLCGCPLIRGEGKEREMDKWEVAREREKEGKKWREI